MTAEPQATRQSRYGTLELSVIAPCFNEADNLRDLVGRTLRVFDTKEINGELILVDDGSEDRTSEVMREQAQLHPGRIKPIMHGANRGIEAAWRSGLEASQGVYTCLIDADLQNQPEDIYRLYREIKFSRVDLVQGTRSHIGRLTDSRLLLSLGLNWLLNTCFRMRARDNKSGFVLCRREVLAEVLRHQHRYRYFQTLITVAAKARGFRIREVETLFESRIHGRSFMGRRFPAKIVFHCIVDIAKALHEYRPSRYHDALVDDFVKTRLPRSAPPPVIRGLRRMWFKSYARLMPLHHWMITRKAGTCYEMLDRSQWLAPDTVKELQEAKLRRLIDHAYRHVAFYREAMDGLGVRPEQIQTLEDLRKLPLLGKQQVREHLYFDLMSDNHRKKDVYRITTSGSTGEPLTCWADRHQLEMRWAATLRSQQWTGYRFGDRSVRLWHQTINMERAQVLKERLDSWLCRRRLVPVFELDSDGVRKMEQLIRSHRPSLVDGYTESFHHLAASGLDPGLRSAGIGGIMSSAQTLDDRSREAIEKAFGTRVFDKYGAREFSGIAYECEAHAGHHVVAECCHVEILADGRPAKPGEPGEVVVTDLNNYVMPFIRYRIGDLAYAVDNSERCACGRGLPRIGAVEGRVRSTLLGTNGVAVPGSFFLHVLKDYGYAVSRFQVEQSTPGEIVFRYVPAARFHPRVLETVFAEFRRYLGSDMKITEQPVESIGMVPEGKYRVVINRMPLGDQ